MATVTLVGPRLAAVGREFVFRGEAPACEGCPYRDQCLNLTEGVRYEVTDVREGGQTLPCGVHDAGVVAVEVEPATIRATVPADVAFAGSTVELAGPCPHTGCPSHEFCEPDGAEFDRSYVVSEVVGDPPHDYCALDRDLALVELEPPEDA